MEWVTRGLRLRNRSLKPIKIPVRSPTSSFGNQDDYEEEPVSPSSLLFHEPNFNIYNVAIMGGRNGFDPDLAFEKLPHTLLKHPRFTCVQVVDDKDGKMKWVPTNVNLHNHIIIPTIPQTLTCPDKFLEDYMYNLSKSSIDSSKPMWELHLLNLKTSHAEAIGIFRIHHSLGDGISLMSLLLACGRQVSNPEAVPTIPTKKGSNTGWLSSYSNSFDVSGTMWRRFFMAIYMVCMLLWNTLVDVLYVMVTALFLKDTETPLKASEGSEFRPRRFVYRIVSLDDMKLIKNALNTVIN